MKKFLEMPFLGRGFRPFFLMGAIYAVYVMTVWGGVYGGSGISQTLFGDPVLWHAHEMIFGFTVAIIAGFLLTAVANWTGGAPTRQAHLLVLSLLWLGGRVAINCADDLPLWFVAILDCSFLPVLAVSLSIPLVKSRNKRNFVFLFLLAAFFTCNVLFYSFAEKWPLYPALMIIMIMISLIGGRVIPAFTVAALRRKGMMVYQKDQYSLDLAAVASLGVLIISMAVVGPEHIITGTIALISSVLHAIRMKNYYLLPSLKDPMLWMLHVGYSWLVVGLASLSASAFWGFPVSAAIHALTAGAIGTMTISMMTRVALAHTGRELIANPLMLTAFFIMIGAGLLRVIGPVLMADDLALSMEISAYMWAACFAIYIINFSAILWSKRPDGLPA
ncbi:MAG TPA: NnrS family protein [Alphaproteobacteria bacterium]|nr:NnrS family protein [Alphaproteobacteria bacterium]HNS45135.1 NnrS family protein [Alphaproteobacteria bacterium]